MHLYIATLEENRAEDLELTEFRSEQIAISLLINSLEVCRCRLYDLHTCVAFLNASNIIVM